MNPTPPQAAGSLNRFLNAIEAAGNKLPHITMLFIWALVITLVISLALSYERRRSPAQISEVTGTHRTTAMAPTKLWTISTATRSEERSWLSCTP